MLRISGHCGHFFSHIFLLILGVFRGGGGQACDENRDYALFFFNCRDPYGKTHKKIIGFSVVEQLWSGHNQPPPLPLRP